MAAPKPDKHGNVGAHGHGRTNKARAHEGVAAKNLKDGYTTLRKVSVTESGKTRQRPKVW